MLRCWLLVACVSVTPAADLVFKDVLGIDCDDDAFSSVIVHDSHVLFTHWFVGDDDTMVSLVVMDDFTLDKFLRVGDRILPDHTPGFVDPVDIDDLRDGDTSTLSKKAPVWIERRHEAEGQVTMVPTALIEYRTTTGRSVLLLVTDEKNQCAESINRVLASIHLLEPADRSDPDR